MAPSRPELDDAPVAVMEIFRLGVASSFVIWWAWCVIVHVGIFVVNFPHNMAVQ